MSPFRSEAQRRFMYARHPEIAKRWTKKYGSKIRKKKSKEEHSPTRVMRREGTA